MQGYCWEGSLPFEEAFFMELKKEKEKEKENTNRKINRSSSFLGLIKL